jgi:hypothetical protein
VHTFKHLGIRGIETCVKRYQVCRGLIQDKGQVLQFFFFKLRIWSIQQGLYLLKTLRHFKLHIWIFHFFFCRPVKESPLLGIEIIQEERNSFILEAAGLQCCDHRWDRPRVGRINGFYAGLQTMKTKRKNFSLGSVPTAEALSTTVKTIIIRFRYRNPFQLSSSQLFFYDGELIPDNSIGTNPFK